MKLASYLIGGRPTWGIIEGEEAFHAGMTLGAKYPDLKSLIAANAYREAAAARGAAQRSPVAELTWQPVIPNPDKILCVGLNYETHRKETGRAEVEHPTIFARFAQSQTAHLADILRPRVSTELDFEGELAVVIGKAGRYIEPAKALAHVAGYCLLQRRQRARLAAPHPPVHAGEEFSADGRVWPLDDDFRRAWRPRRSAHFDAPQR